MSVSEAHLPRSPLVSAGGSVRWDRGGGDPVRGQWGGRLRVLLRPRQAGSVRLSSPCAARGFPDHPAPPSASPGPQARGEAVPSGTELNDPNECLLLRDFHSEGIPIIQENPRVQEMSRGAVGVPMCSMSESRPESPQDNVPSLSRGSWEGVGWRWSRRNSQRSSSKQSTGHGYTVGGSGSLASPRPPRPSPAQPARPLGGRQLNSQASPLP